VTVCALQKSQYGPRYYVNIGCNFVRLDGQPHPRAEDCHLTLRVDDLLGTDAGVMELRALLDLEIPMPERDREERLFEIFEDRLVPAVHLSATVAGLDDMTADGTLPDYTLTRTAREVLGLPIPGE
jgi:hypothetical protein